jgi:hypothetical protein
MLTMQMMWQLILADFRERTRRYSFLITLMTALFLGYLVLTGKYSYHFGEFVPVYNSAWVGTTVAMAGAAMFSFLGFYIVRTSISRDRDTRVGEILLTTRLSGIAYLLAKFASNLLVLWAMVAALALTAFTGMVVNMSITRIDLIAFITPFLLFPIVTTIPVAAAAVLFDTVRWMRGVVGNILYFMLAQYVLIAGFLNMPFVDAAGIGQLRTHMETTLGALFPGEPAPMSVGFVFGREFVTERSFLWDGLDWTPPLLLSRLVWPALALVMIALAVLLFDRFEQAGKKFKSRADTANLSDMTNRLAAMATPVPTMSYQSVLPVRPRESIFPLLLAELRLALKDVNLVWLVIGLGIVVSEILAPFEIVRRFIVPAAMVWPLVIWSAIGARQTLFDMKSLMFSSAGVHSRQFIAMLLAGIAVAVVMCLPMLVRAAAAGEFAYLALLAASVLLMPATAFALGVVSGSRKFFEVIYPLIWYGGSIDNVKPIDLLGTSADSVGTTRGLVFIVLAAGSVATAWLYRRRSVTE